MKKNKTLEQILIDFAKYFIEMRKSRTMRGCSLEQYADFFIKKNKLNKYGKGE